MQLIADDFLKAQPIETLDLKGKVKLYESLKRCKNYAINKSYKNFFNIPIERQDLETIAWFAFEEVLEKFATYEGRKTFESFFIDNVFWKCNDYCEKFTNNRHKILNYANTKNFYQDWNYQSTIVQEDWNKWIALKQYYWQQKDPDKKVVFRMLFKNYRRDEIEKANYFSRTKVYRIIKLIAKDLRDIV